MLSRDLEHLNALGYDIRNVADIGTDGVYVMRARDNRLQVHLSPEQRGELLRAALAAGLEGMAPHLGADDGGAPPAAPASADLDLVQRGTTRHCRLHFTYKGEPRTVHPARVHSGPSGWYLSGREDGSEVVKEFVVSRMSDIALDAPGSAEVVGEPVRRSLDPLSWEVDPPTEVVLEVPEEHRVLAENLLGTPAQVAESGSALAMTYVVTNRQVFRNRVYELGTRVRVRVARRGARRDPGRAGRPCRRTVVSPVAVYAQRLAALPGALGILELHPQGLPLADLAARARRRAGRPARGLHGLLPRRPGRARQLRAAGGRVLRTGRGRRAGGRRGDDVDDDVPRRRSGSGCSPPTRSTSWASTT